MKIVKRVFFRFYQFYSRIESDEVMIFYFSSFAISFLLAFYALMVLALIYLVTGIKLIEVSGKSLTILFVGVIAVFLYLFFRNKKQLSDSIKKMNKAYGYEDVFVWGFTIFAIVSLFWGGIILTR